MSTVDYALLAERYITGAISATERIELLRLLDADPSLQRQFPRDVALSVRLAAMVRADGAGDALVARIEAVLAGNHESTRQRVVQQVEERLEARSAAAPAPAASRMRLRRRPPSPPPRARAGMRLALCAGILVVVALALVLARLPEATPRLTIAEAATIDDRPARSGDPLPVGSRLQVGARGRAVIDLPAIAVLELRAGELRLGDPAGRRIALESGRLSATVQHQERGEVRVATPQGEIRVHGTRFAVSASPASTWLEVSDGRVGFASGASAVEVGAGDQAISAGGRTALLPPARPIDWPDRRPIGAQHLASPTLITPDNPRGWYLDDARPGPLPFAVRFERRRTRIVRELVADLGTARPGINAQAMVLWNLEGCAQGSSAERGDPRALGRLAPEMDAVVDRHIARLRSAGLRIGVPLAPRAGCLDAQDAAQDVSDAIAWCQHRWQASVFVIFPTPVIAQGSPRALFLDRVRRAHPEALILVQGGGSADTAAAAPLMFVPVDGAAAWTLPAQGFAVIGMVDADRAGAAYVSWLADALHAGHIPLVYAWSGFTDYAVLRLAQAEAARRYSQPALTPGR